LILALKLAVSIGLLVLLFSKIDAERLWSTARHASITWLALALLLYTVNVVFSVWRWQWLLLAQRVNIASSRLWSSLLVALFFNNFLPSNIGGDVIRITDTAGPARSKTLATLVVLGDRVLGLIALVFVAAVGATVVQGAPAHTPAPVLPVWLWVAFIGAASVTAPAVLAPWGVSRILQPLTVLHPEWVGTRIETVTVGLGRFREHPQRIAACFAAAIVVQALAVLFYVSIARALGVPVSSWDMAVIVPMTAIAQMLPVSVGGFGVREAAFSIYFRRLGLSIESAILVSLMGVVLIMLFSLSGAVAYVSRGRSGRPSGRASSKPVHENVGG
jgi:uncharacterized membrane protein YbhN (UPF0104 family)